MTLIATALQFAAKTAWIATSRIALFAVFGILLNSFLFYALSPYCTDGSYFFCTRSIVLGIILMAIFPLLYLFFGYRYMVKKVIHYVYSENRDKLFAYTAHQLSGMAKSVPAAAIARTTSSFFQQLEKLPFVFRVALKALKNFVPFAEVVEKMSQDAETSWDNPQIISQKLSLETDKYIKEELLKPDITLPAILFGVNIAVALLAYFIR